MNLDLKLYQEIQKDFGELLERLAAELISGRATDFADYRYRCGKISAIKEALSIAHEANRRAIGLEDKDT